MVNFQNHIIDKVFLEVNTTDEKTAYKIKNNISSFLNSEVFPKLEKLLDKYDFNDQVFRIDSLEVDFNIQDWEKPADIKFEFLKSIEQKIDASIPDSIKDNLFENQKLENSKERNKSLNQIINKQDNYQNTILFFLENGFLPWFGKQEYIEEIVLPENWTRNLKQTQFLSDLTLLFQSNVLVIKRFILQFPNQQIVDYIKAVEIIKIKNKQELLNYLKGLTPQSRYLFLNLLLKISLNATDYKMIFVEFAQQHFYKNDFNKITNQMVVDWNYHFLLGIEQYFTTKTKLKFFQFTTKEISLVVKNINFAGTHLGVESEEFVKTNLENKPTIFLQDFMNSEREKEPAYFENYRNEIIVRNAGMVLFHPFLKAYFSQFGWIDNSGEIKAEYRYEAVQALHYCATGNESFFEANLALEKFLCNVPLKTPIPYKSLLSRQMKLEANTMITQLITYWAALKNTSPAGLREMFINRNGKLIQKENDFRLIVERKVQDILLDKLQWNISIVKLPWKDDLLFVEW